jgi:hypothetical protein
MQEERFSASDLEPSPTERRELAERVAASIAVLAVGVWVGGMVALGACAAPFVFRLTPAPFSGYAMGAAFARFDRIALAAAALLLAAEVVRTWATLGRARTVAARIRRLAAIVMAGAAAYLALSLTPQIGAMHRAGVHRGVGAEGAALDAIHARAELVGKAEVLLGVVLIGLHVLTLPRRRDDDEPVTAPLPPGGS